ncbi:MAG: hypothetical protein ACJ79M_09660, partial [Myxococcales bacterium]
RRLGHPTEPAFGRSMEETMATIPIRIRIRKPTAPGYTPDITVDPTQVHARKDDKFRWDLEGGGKFSLEFLQESPLAAKCLDSDGGGGCEGHVATAASGMYKYAIRGKTADGTEIAITQCPEIIIQ